MVWRDHGHVQSQDGINTPALGFGRRVAVPYGGKVYACSHHHKLAYQTQREQAHDRAGSRLDTIRKRLGWDAGILNGNGNKPKGIRAGGNGAKMGILEGRLAGLQINS